MPDCAAILSRLLLDLAAMTEATTLDEEPAMDSLSESLGMLNAAQLEDVQMALGLFKASANRRSAHSHSGRTQ